MGYQPSRSPKICQSTTLCIAACRWSCLDPADSKRHQGQPVRQQSHNLNSNKLKHVLEYMGSYLHRALYQSCRRCCFDSTVAHGLVGLEEVGLRTCFTLLYPPYDISSNYSSEETSKVQKMGKMSTLSTPLGFPSIDWLRGNAEI